MMNLKTHRAEPEEMTRLRKSREQEQAELTEAAALKYLLASPGWKSLRQCISRVQDSLLNTVKHDGRSAAKLDAAGRLAGIDIVLELPEQRRAEIADYFATVYGYSLEEIEAEADMISAKTEDL